MNATIGPVAVLPLDGLPRRDEVSEETQRLVDDEVRKLVATAHDDVTRLVTEHRHQLDSLAEALLEHETLDQADAYAAARIETDQAGTPGGVAVAARTISVRPRNGSSSSRHDGPGSTGLRRPDDMDTGS